MNFEEFQKEAKEIQDVVVEETKKIEHFYQWADLEKWYYEQMNLLLKKSGLYKEES